MKRDTVLSDPKILSAPIVAPAETHRDDAGLGPARKNRRPFAVAIEQQHPVRGQKLGEPAFLLGHAVQVIEKFEMLAPDAGDDANPRVDHADQRREFPGMIRADLEHRRPVALLQIQQRQRHPDVVVKTGLAPKRVELLPEDSGDEFLGRRLAVGTADGNHWHLKIFTVTRAQISQRDPRVFHGDDAHVRGQIRRQLTAALRDQHCADGLRSHIAEVIMTIEFLPRERDEKVVRLRAARVGRDAGDGRIRAACEQFARARLGNKFQVTALHKTHEIASHAAWPLPWKPSSSRTSRACRRSSNGTTVSSNSW